MFSSCEPAEYRHWLLGCRDCPRGCAECKGKFIGGANCLRCSSNIFEADGDCFFCAEGEYVLQDSELECVPCNYGTPYCTACELMNGKCSACASTFVLDSNFACVCASGDTLNEPVGLCETTAVCDDDEYVDNTNSCADCIPYCESCTDGLTCDTCATGHEGLTCETCENGYYPTF